MRERDEDVNGDSVNVFYIKNQVQLDMDNKGTSQFRSTKLVYRKCVYVLSTFVFLYI